MSSDLTRSNYSANSILTSSALNADFNQILARINDFPGDQITALTVPKTALELSATYLGVTTKTGNYTITASDTFLLADATSASFTLTLPAAGSHSGLVLRIKKIDSSLTNTVTIDGNGSETIEGSTTKIMYTQNEVYIIVSDGTNWRVVEHKTTTPWTAYTPTFTGFGTATSINFKWMRVGANLFVEGTFTHGTCTAVENRITYPSTWTSASTIATLENAGAMLYGANLGSIFALSILREASVNYMTVGYTASGVVGLAKNSSTSPYGGNNVLSLKMSTPITGWED
jgi:hypothetical protein